MGSLLNKKKNRKKIQDEQKSPEIEKKEIKITRNSIKLALLGESGVGKSSICTSILGYDLENYNDIIKSGKVEKKQLLNNGKEIRLIIWDTVGQERFRSVALKTANYVDGIIIVFDVIYRRSFDNLEGWFPEIKENCYKDPIIILFANKVDVGEDRRQVSREEIENFMKAKNLVYFEISAKNRTGIDDGISYIANKIYNKMMGN